MFPNWLGLQQLEESLAHPTHGVSFDSMGRRIQSSMYRMAAELSRVARVKEAVERSVPLGMANLRHTLAGIDLGSVLHVLTSLLRDLLAAYACGALVGGAVGGAIGAFAGAGVGAVPGAIGGVGLGMSLTTWLLGWLGLGLLAKEIAESLPAAFKEYRDGALEAWGPPNEPAYASHREPFAPTGSVGLAAMRMARGHRLLLLTLLSGIMMYFSRGAASRLELLSKIRSSQRLGPAVAVWIEANERKLMEHPALRRRTSEGQGGGAAADGGAAHAESFERVARGEGQRGVGNTAGTEVERYVAGLKTKTTPTGTNAGLFEVEQAGPLNYRVTGGGTAVDVDGYRGTTLLEAKYVGNPSASPYVEDSDVPSFIREKILKEQQYEFQRYRAVINDPKVPFESLNVLTNESTAVPYFKRLMNAYEIPGQVKVVPTNIPQKGTGLP